MKIEVRKAWTDNEFEQTWHVDEDGQLVCSHINIEHEPGQNGGLTDPSWEAYDWCVDCGKVFDHDNEPDWDLEADRMAEERLFSALEAQD